MFLKHSSVSKFNGGYKSFTAGQNSSLQIPD